MPQRLPIVALALLPTLVAAQSTTSTFPDRPIQERPVRFVVGFTPGGPSDLIARTLANALAATWPQTVFVENRPGAGGNIAAEVVAKSAPDGGTWLLGNNSILATNASLYRRLAYDPVRDFAPVALVATQPNILVVNPQLPAHSVSELVALAKVRLGQLNYASSGSGAFGRRAVQSHDADRYGPYSVQGCAARARRCALG